MLARKLLCIASRHARGQKREGGGTVAEQTSSCSFQFFLRQTQIEPSKFLVPEELHSKGELLLDSMDERIIVWQAGP